MQELELFSPGATVGEKVTDESPVIHSRSMTEEASRETPQSKPRARARRGASRAA